MGNQADIEGWDSKDDFDKLTQAENQQFWREISAIF